MPLREGKVSISLLLDSIYYMKVREGKSLLFTANEVLKAASGEWAGRISVSDCNGIVTYKWPVCQRLLLTLLESSSQRTREDGEHVLCARYLTRTISFNPHDKRSTKDFYSYSRDEKEDALRSGLAQIK